MAISLDDNFLKKVNKVYQMGGSIKGIGNKRPNVEFNFAADPESNFLLFNSSKKSQITMYPWENSVDAILTKVRYEYLHRFLLTNMLSFRTEGLADECTGKVRFALHRLLQQN